MLPMSANVWADIAVRSAFPRMTARSISLLVLMGFESARVSGDLFVVALTPVWLTGRLRDPLWTWLDAHRCSPQCSMVSSKPALRNHMDQPAFSLLLHLHGHCLGLD